MAELNGPELSPLVGWRRENARRVERGHYVAQVVVVMLVSMALFGCDDPQSRENHWLAYATARNGQIEWLFLDGFRDADDCYHTAHFYIDSKRDGDAYRCPAGCVYASNSKWGAYFINQAYQLLGYSQPGAMECLVARSTLATAEKLGQRYSPVTKGSPREGATYYCVL